MAEKRKCFFCDGTGEMCSVKPFTFPLEVPE